MVICLAENLGAEIRAVQIQNRRFIFISFPKFESLASAAGNEE